MVEKTLSTGTLSLRFMQNARRAPPVAPPQAHVKDDAAWEVPPETRQAWGPDAYRGEKAVTYETSYLPFLFHDTPPPDGQSSPTLPPRGRRVFNKRGEDTPHQAPTAPPPEPTRPTQPRSISTRQPKTTAKHPPKDAKNVIFDTSGVGTDLRHQATAFLRPAGVDAPADAPKRPGSSGDTDMAKKKTRLDTPPAVLSHR